MMQCMNCRGLLARCVMQAQAASPTFTHVYAALVAVINTKVSFALIVYAIYRVRHKKTTPKRTYISRED